MTILNFSIKINQIVIRIVDKMTSQIFSKVLRPLSGWTKSEEHLRPLQLWQAASRQPRLPRLNWGQGTWAGPPPHQAKGPTTRSQATLNSDLIRLKEKTSAKKIFSFQMKDYHMVLVQFSILITESFEYEWVWSIVNSWILLLSTNFSRLDFTRIEKFGWIQTV